MNRILSALRAARSSGRMALCGYFLTGYPTPRRFYSAVRAAGALDVLEFGIPTPEPLLDGPTIAHAHDVVTNDRGLCAETALALLSGLRETQQPRLVMTYAATGRSLGGFLRRCVEAGVDGLLVPDMDQAEADYVIGVVRAMGMCAVVLVDSHASRSELEERIHLADLVYVKASRGRSGERVDLEGEAGRHLDRTVHAIRLARPELPIAVGIGISEATQVRSIARLGVDMVIVGTCLVECTDRGDCDVQLLAERLRAATWYPRQGCFGSHCAPALSSLPEDEPLDLQP